MAHFNDNSKSDFSAELFNPILLQEILSDSTNWELADLESDTISEQLEIQEISYSEFTSTLI